MHTPARIYKKDEYVLVDHKPPVQPLPVVIKAANLDQRKYDNGVLARTRIGQKPFSFRKEAL